MTCSLVLIASLAPAQAVFPGGAAAPVSGTMLRRLERLRRGPGAPGAVFAAPGARARQTLEGLGLDGATEAALRDADFGTWAGRFVSEVQESDPARFAEWLRDPTSAPHGGESLAEVQARVAGWMRGLAGARHVLAVADTGIVRAAAVEALGLGLAAHRCLDVRPAEAVRLSGNGERWRLIASAAAL